MGHLGLEPRTIRLKAEYSTIELVTRNYYFIVQKYFKFDYETLKYQNLLKLGLPQNGLIKFKNTLNRFNLNTLDLNRG